VYPDEDRIMFDVAVPVATGSEVQSEIDAIYLSGIAQALGVNANQVLFASTDRRRLTGSVQRTVIVLAPSATAAAQIVDDVAAPAFATALATNVGASSVIVSAAAPYVAPLPCSITCELTDLKIQVLHSTLSGHSHHRCWHDGSTCQCLCGNGSVPDRV